MKKFGISVIIGISIFLCPYVKAAEQQSEEEQRKVIFKKTESHRFSGLKLKGQLKKPDLSYIYKRKGLRAEKIVSIPEDFNDEIIQGAGQF